MRGLYSSRVEILRMQSAIVNGSMSMTWVKLEDQVDPYLGSVGEMMCRLDMTFVRPGKDILMPAVAGRAPDRVGLMFCDMTDKLLAGDRIRAIAGPISGTFELRVIPDIVQNYQTAHHLEVQVIEVSQSLTVFHDAGDNLE